MPADRDGVYVSPEELARQQMMGALVTAATKQLRSLDVPWGALPRHKQEIVLNEVREDVGVALFDAVDIIASDNRTRFRAGCESVTFKDGVKAVLVMKSSAAAHELADAAGGSVLIVIEDPSRYTSGEEGMPQSQDDQRPLM